MDLVLQSILPSVSTIRFKEAVCGIIDRDDSSEIEWSKLEDLVVECAGTSSAVFREHPFLVHKILPKHPPVSVVNAVVSGRPECLALLDSYRPENSQRRMDATPLGIACRSGCSLDVIRFLIGKMVQLRSESRFERVFADFEKDRAGGLFATTGFDHAMNLDIMRVLVEEHPDGILAQSDKVGKASLIAQLLLMRRNQEATFGNNEEGIDSDKYLEMLGIVFRKETELGIPLSHAMMEVFASTGRFAPYDDNAKILSCAGRIDSREFTVQVQIGTTQHTFRDSADTEGEKTRDYMLLDHDRILQVLQLVRMNQPQCCKKADVHGRTLLHIALSNPRNWKHAHSRTYGFEVIQFLLNSFPEAVSVKDGEGRYPLQVAIENICPCYEIVLEATPASILETIRHRNGLYLFQIPPRQFFRMESQATLWTEISYRMLKKAPTLARGLAANPDPWLESDTFKKIQIAKMRREQESGKIAVLERQLEQLKLSCRIGEND